MAKKDKDRNRKRQQEQWDRENAEIDMYRALGPRYKVALQAQGCDLPFYEVLDSAEEEFHKLVAWGKAECRSLHGVFEVSPAELEDESDWGRLRLPGEWTQVTYTCDDALAESYTARDRKANLRGAATGFRDGAGGFHTVIQVVRNPDCKWEHKEYKYLLKLPVLLHEIGYVKDYEVKVNFDRDTGRADLIEGEVYAHVFALTECFRRAYYLSGEMFLASLSDYRDAQDYRGEVARRLLQRFTPPAYKKWTDYEVTPPGVH